MVSLNQILLSLIQAMNAKNQPAVVGWDEVVPWSEGILEQLVKVGILASTTQAKSLECKGCEHSCFVDVIMQTNKIVPLNRAFIICDTPEMQNQMGRIEVPLQCLQQWQCSVSQLVKIIAKLLGIKDKIENQFGKNNIRIRMLKGSQGRRWVSLNTDPLSVEINNQTAPLEEILFFENNQLAIDQFWINEKLNGVSQNKGKVYIPSTSKREESKRKILARNQDWKDEYLWLKNNNPDKSDVWCSLMIAKMDTGQGKEAETIRKNMK